MEAVVERDVVTNLERHAGTSAGMLWCLVATKWHLQWDAFSSQASPLRPEAIDNAALVDERGMLRPALCDGPDYVLVPEAVWSKLVSWYGGGPKLTRPMIETGLKKRLVVEVYPMRVRVVERRNAARCETVDVSKAAGGSALLALACRALFAPPKRSKLWILGAEGYSELPLNKVGFVVVVFGCSWLSCSLWRAAVSMTVPNLCLKNRFQTVRLSPTLRFGSVPRATR